MSADDEPESGGPPWHSSRKTTNYLLGLLIVVTAAGFVSIGGGDYDRLRFVADLVLGLVLVGALLLFLGLLMRDDAA